MKISLNWLKDYVDITETPDELSEILTSLGLEVEGVERIESVEGGLEGLVIGQVIECGKHPNADKLSLTKVDVGTGTTLQIVCGAPNVRKGQKVVVAIVGTKLYPVGGEPFVISKGKIRGEFSEGMICAEDEIGIGNDHSGIIVLPGDVVVGTYASEYYNIEIDYVYEIGLTPNRSDATSHLGVARDLAAYYSFHSGKRVSVKMPDLSAFRPGVETPVQVRVEDKTACPRYSAISVENVSVGQAPQWMRNRLKAIDVRSINNIVDITNYVLHEYGQPLHAFDQDAISGSTVLVKKLSSGSKFISLDEIERTLDAEDLMICDGDSQGMCIAGVFGGAKSGVKEHTARIFLESAHFNAQGIRKTSTRHNLRSDAAKCYEKGSDPNITVEALKRAVQLMEKYAGAKVSSSLIDHYPEPIQPLTIKVRPGKVNQLIGAQLNHEVIARILEALHMTFEIDNEQNFLVAVPTDKADVVREVDVIEEILRIYGFNNVEITNRINAAITPSVRPNLPLIRQTIARMLRAKGFHEIMGLSLIPSQYYNNILKDIHRDIVFINNTSNIHLDAMRPEMLLSTLLSVQYNHNRQQRDLKLFEFGHCYRKKGDSFSETEKLTITFTGSQNKESWIRLATQSDFYTLKKCVFEVLEQMGIDKYQISETDDERFDYGLKYHRGQQHIVSFGKVRKGLSELMEVKSSVFYAEFDVLTLLKLQKDNIIEVTDIPKYPVSRRDLALTIDDDVSYAEIEKIISTCGKSTISDLNLFDVYRDDTVIGKGKKSYAISMIFSDPEKNLSDKDIDKIISKIIYQCQHSLGATLR